MGRRIATENSDERLKLQSLFFREQRRQRGLGLRVLRMIERAWLVRSTSTSSARCRPSLNGPKRGIELPVSGLVGREQRCFSIVWRGNCGPSWRGLDGVDRKRSPEYKAAHRQNEIPKPLSLHGGSLSQPEPFFLMAGNAFGAELLGSAIGAGRFCFPWAPSRWRRRF